ncbi:MAG: Alkyl hydroperoxide reductase E [Anaerolineales bacterium]|nr:Alkyl hydroperoxide reductase E [Anaerolineales bacterium]
MAKFAGLNAQVLGISVDHVPCLTAWAESLGQINYPLLSDFWPHGEVAEKYGVLRSEGYTERALFIIDKAGIIQYIDIHDIDDQPANEVLLAELRRIDPQAAASAPPDPETTELPHGGIVMYCSQWCPDCKQARAWLQAHDLDYVEVDVNAVPGAATQVRQWADGNLVTPTFDIDGTIILDFDQEKLQELLD